jgi:hypothetical protein
MRKQSIFSVSINLSQSLTWMEACLKRSAFPGNGCAALRDSVPITFLSSTQSIWKTRSPDSWGPIYSRIHDVLAGIICSVVSDLIGLALGPWCSVNHEIPITRQSHHFTPWALESN